MSLRFSNEGPAFPEKLVNALLTGDVVFLCGAGVSAPQLPGFGGLVRQCFERLRLEMNASESQSFDAYRYEEVLGSLSRRIVNPTEFTQTITELLRPPAEPDLGNHRTILRLSRDRENRPAIITTNFDTLLEQALLEFDDTKQVQALSFAGQDLPSPGSAGFGGIIHLHGRIADEAIELKETPLVVTSADYGDAYMRSGWASRFLFDLCRCKTIVLIGYSAGDAPVRYFLNVLDADRQRFPDLRHVYALADVAARGEADTRWETLAVTPIFYEYMADPETGEKDHGALWRDLERLADVVERPRATRHAWAQEILAKPYSDADTAEIDRVAWLFNGRRDLWAVAIATIEDAAWLDFFADRKLWNEADGAWVVAAWVARSFESVERYGWAIGWMRKLGKPFAAEISRRLRQAKGLSEFWLRAWRILSISQAEHKPDWDERSYAVQQTLRSSVVLNTDLEKAVGLLKPVLELTPNRGNLYGEPAPAIPTQLSHLTWPRLDVKDRGGARELLDAVIAVPQACAIMSIATAQLQSVVGLSLDIDAIRGDYDSNDFSVPSVEPHEQNKHHDGPIFLVELLARLLRASAEADRSATRGLTEIWRAMPGMLGTRLWLHALRSPILFTADEAISELAELSLSHFWHVRRELALVLRDRAADADSELLSVVEHRILTEGEVYYARYEIEEGQVDWRAHARDTAVWLRLNMIGTAGRLSDAGIAELAAIKARRDYLDRDVADRDYFGSYSTGVRWVAGDAQPIKDASQQDRLEVAREAIRSPDIEKREGWNAYCRSDPNGAFDTLSQAPLDEANAPLWHDLIGSIAFPKDQHDPTWDQLVTSIFATLEPATEAFLNLIIGPLADLYCSAPRRTAPGISAWWPRLLSTTIAQNDVPFEPSRELLFEAFNSPVGRLTQAALADIEESQKAGEPVKQEVLDAISQLASTAGRQGLLASAVLVEAVGFVLAIEGQQVSGIIDAALTGDTAEAMALRSVLVTYADLTVSASRAFSVHVLRGVTEIDDKPDSATAAAAKIIAPALSIVRGEADEVHWGVTLDEVARVLRVGPPALRKGAADILKQWITQIEGGPAAAWRTGIGPLLAKVWPRERALRQMELTRHFADLAIKAEEAFPEALEWVLPYLSVIEGHWGVYVIEESEAPEKFPRETLTLLWRLFGIDSTGDLYGIPKILDRLIAAMPAIEFDRRLQWLDQRAIRYD
ncbi:SIR2 family protein [Rhizobiaceae bacterium BDR2-2]|uniref:SIR2 family protein n=1 Tax=Ectorhizobium quercum TaxID=2965071 RepID=A0AAE3N576_9HYPH|nr:SIR2 family protein [Ectorhizobium quercum]MCX8999914.1 SIR2 family protein [Ectorhizobium quercum]